MQDLQITDDIFEWKGDTEILKNSNYKITVLNQAKIIGVDTDTAIEGIIILGEVEAVVDTIIHTPSHGAVGSTTVFSGTNLVILGLSINDLQDNMVKIQIPEQKLHQLRDEAESMIFKLKRTILRHNSSIGLDNEDEEMEYMIFGRKNFLLIASKEKLVLVHNKQISIRENDFKLVQIDPQDGILIANKDKVFNIGGSASSKLTCLGKFGVGIATSVLDHILWE